MSVLFRKSVSDQFDEHVFQRRLDLLQAQDAAAVRYQRLHHRADGRLLLESHLEFHRGRRRRRGAGVDAGEFAEVGPAIRAGGEAQVIERVRLHAALERGGSVAGQDLPLVDDRDAVAQLISFRHVVRGEEQGSLGALLHPVADEGADGAGARHVEAERRLIQEEDLRDR